MLNNENVAEIILKNPLLVTPEHIAGLPQSIIKELSLRKVDIFEANVINLINSAGGEMILDNILIGLYLLNGEEHKRIPLSNKLYRMAQKKLIFSVPGRKGVYTTKNKCWPKDL